MNIGISEVVNIREPFSTLTYRKDIAKINLLRPLYVLSNRLPQVNGCEPIFPRVLYGFTQLSKRYTDLQFSHRREDSEGYPVLDLRSLYRLHEEVH